jgi:hypothetical protein
MSVNPYANDHSNTSLTPSEPLSSHPMQPLKDAGHWLVFLGWVWLILGALYCLTIIGIIVAWLPIWMGVLMRRSGEQLKQGFLQGNNGVLYLASRDLAMVITILGITTVIALIGNLLVLGLLMIGALLGNM